MKKGTGLALGFLISMVAVVCICGFCCSDSFISTNSKTYSSSDSSSAEAALACAKNGTINSGRDAAISINTISDNDKYNEALRSVLDYYYENNEKGQNSGNIRTVGKTIDSRGNVIVQNYRTASNERSKAKTLSYKTGEVILTFGSGTSDAAIKKAAAEQRGTVDAIHSTMSGTKIASIDISLEYTVSKASSRYETEKNVKGSQPNYIYRTSETSDDTSSSASSVSQGSDVKDTGTGGTGDTGTGDTGETKFTAPNDKYYTEGLQWYLNGANGIDAPAAWAVADSKSSAKTTVKVAVIDTGVKTTNEDLNAGQIDTANCAKITGGKITTGASSIDYEEGHGTHVTGIIGATSNNSVGITGVATGVSNSAVSIMMINAETAFFSGGVFYSEDLVLSVDYAVSKSAKIVNMSLGGPGNDKLLADEIAAADKKGTLVVTAAGNEGSDALVSPSDSPYSFSVIANSEQGSSTSGGDDFSQYSNYGYNKDISAPGDDILSTWVGDKNGYNKIGADPGNTKYAYDQGTSMAAPIVTGTAALLLYYDPTLTTSQIKNYLCSSSGKTSFSSTQAFGNLNAGQALTDLAADQTDASSIVLNRSSMTVYTGDSSQIACDLLPGTASKKTVTWSSSDTGVASVSTDGIVTGVSAGTAAVTASSGTASSTCAITVKAKYSPLAFIDSSASVSGELTKESPVSTSIYASSGKYDDAAGYMEGYSLDLLKGQSISAEESSSSYGAFIKIVNSDGKIVVSESYDDFDEDVKENNSSTVTYCATSDGTYYIQCCAVPNYSVEHDGYFSSTGAFTLDAYTFDPCYSKISKVTYNSVYLKWTRSENANGYKIQRASSKSGTYKTIKTITSNSTLTYRNTGLTCGKTYYYKITPYRTITNKTISGRASSVLTAKVIPAAPSKFSVKAGKGKATVKWSKISGASGYRVYRASSKTGKYKRLTTVKGNSSTYYVNTGLKKGKTYYYKMRAYRQVNKTTKVSGQYSESKYVKVR